ncbi:Aspartate aminotransferase [Colletotrichum shisoi]|uniref:Aspartate aminotransferase n=1 Tax=Colletotrichum shisoi TaxID=2078593 RepID=A0A5Q4BFB2_9PEZI|nr:Aspartate aminotransferase [Colletotrichum shisoi]
MTTYTARSLSTWEPHRTISSPTAHDTPRITTLVRQGTGANSLVAKFVQKNARASAVWLPDPTWIDHADIGHDNAPGVRVRKYPYYNAVTRSFDFDAMMARLECDAREDDVVLLHACAHNPTGLDPSESQRAGFADLCRRKKLFVVFDLAYQGFASGDLAKDAWAVRSFLDSSPLEFAVCRSFSKNLGLYGERVTGHYTSSCPAPGPRTGPAVENAPGRQSTAPPSPSRHSLGAAWQSGAG